MICACKRLIESENDLKRGLCFACHIKGIRIGMTSQFKNTETIREQQRYYEDSNAFKQGKITKVPDRAELI
jgi:hypothetical protein